MYYVRTYIYHSTTYTYVEVLSTGLRAIITIYIIHNLTYIYCDGYRAAEPALSLPIVIYILQLQYLSPN